MPVNVRFFPRAFFTVIADESQERTKILLVVTLHLHVSFVKFVFYIIVLIIVMEVLQYSGSCSCSSSCYLVYLQSLTQTISLREEIICSDNNCNKSRIHSSSIYPAICCVSKRKGFTKITNIIMTKLSDIIPSPWQKTTWEGGEHFKTVVNPPTILEKLNIQLAGRHTARARARAGVFDVKTGDCWMLSLIIQGSASLSCLQGHSLEAAPASWMSKHENWGNRFVIIIVPPAKHTGCEINCHNIHSDIRY